MVMNHIWGLVTLLITTHEPPSRDPALQFKSLGVQVLGFGGVGRWAEDK